MADLKAALKLVKGAGITIPKKEFVKEHTKLVGVLTKGTKKQRLAEAKDQAKELALKGGAMRVVPSGRKFVIVEDVEGGQRIRGEYDTMAEAEEAMRYMSPTPTPKAPPSAPSRKRQLPPQLTTEQQIKRRRLADISQAVQQTQSELPRFTDTPPEGVPRPTARKGRGKKGGSVAMAALGAIMGILAPYLPSDPVAKAVEFGLKQILKAMGAEVPPETIGQLIMSLVTPYLGAAAKLVFTKIMDALKEVASVRKVKGGSRNSGFIQRMMAEVKKKHDGEYKNPTAPLAADTEMNAPVAFDYFMMPSESRAMSKFIMDHFFKIRPYRAGEREQLNEYELKKLRDAEAERQRRSRARRRGGAMTGGGRTEQQIKDSLKRYLEDLIGKIERGNVRQRDAVYNFNEFLKNNSEEKDFYDNIVSHLREDEKFPKVGNVAHIKNVLANIDIILTPRRRTEKEIVDALREYLRGLYNSIMNEEITKEEAKEQLKKFLDENEEEKKLFNNVGEHLRDTGQEVNLKNVLQTLDSY